MGSLLFSTGRTDISRNPGRWQPTSPWSNTILRALGVLSTSGERQSLACLLLALGMGSNLASKLLRESRWTQVSKRKDAVWGVTFHSQKDGVSMAMQHCPLLMDTGSLPLCQFQIIRTFFKVHMKTFRKVKKYFTE